jgi:alpha-methylacyl-CoA racemase
LLALHERHSSGKGQVVDASMVEGVSYISSFLWTSKDTILFSESQGRGTNLLDGGAANYDTYETKDGKFMAVGALEPNFFNLFIQGMGLDSDALPDDPFHPQFVEILAQIFRTKTQQEWCDIFDEVDACVTPVVDLKEAHLYPQNAERASFHPSPVVPLPAPRLDRTPGQPKSFENIVMGQNTVEILLEVGFSQMEIEKLLESKVVEQNTTKSKL